MGAAAHSEAAVPAVLPIHGSGTVKGTITMTGHAEVNCWRTETETLADVILRLENGVLLPTECTP